MRMKQCFVVACDKFHSTEHPHFLGLVFDIYTEQLHFRNPSSEVIKLMLNHSKTTVIYETCNL
jgi:hypothetical protein